MLLPFSWEKDWKETEKGQKYIIPPCDNTEIFKNWNVEQANFGTYIHVDRSIPDCVNFNGIIIPYRILYPGIGRLFPPYHRTRAFTHRNDLLFKFLKQEGDYGCIMLGVGTSRKNAHALETYIINELLEQGYIKTMRGSYDIEIKLRQILNKKRESGDINCLNLNSPWKLHFQNY